MAIRIRKVLGVTVAVCAAETDEKPGDIYLDDSIHHALSTKFGLDWKSMGFISDPPIDTDLALLMEAEKVRDAKASLEEWIDNKAKIHRMMQEPQKVTGEYFFAEDSK